MSNNKDKNSHLTNSEKDEVIFFSAYSEDNNERELQIRLSDPGEDSSSNFSEDSERDPQIQLKYKQ